LVVTGAKDWRTAGGVVETVGLEDDAGGDVGVNAEVGGVVGLGVALKLVAAIVPAGTHPAPVHTSPEDEEAMLGYRCHSFYAIACYHN
jgi:hypothetical protein